MSRSRKKPIYKDVGFRKSDYWKVVRREWNQRISELVTENRDVTFLFEEDQIHGFDLRQPRVIINDYDYRDYTGDWFCWLSIRNMNERDMEWREKLSRK